MKRRGFIRWGSISAVGLFGFSALKKNLFSRYTQTDIATQDQLESLSHGSFVVLSAAVDAILAPSMRAAFPAHRLALEIDKALSNNSPANIADFSKALWALEFPLSRGSTQKVLFRFSSLSRSERREVLDGWRLHSLTTYRQAYEGLRKLTLATYYARSERSQILGYSGPAFVKAPAPLHKGNYAQQSKSWSAIGAKPSKALINAMQTQRPKAQQ